MRVLLVGHGRVGRLVASLAEEYGCEIAGVIDRQSAPDLARGGQGRWGAVDVAIDFSSPEAVPVNVPALARQGINLVVGTTGWQAHEQAVREAVAQAGIGIVVASNFATGAVIFDAVVAQAARLFRAQTDFGAWLHEAHHAAKRDAPSGTALRLKRTMEQAGYSGPIDVSWTRAGQIPGTHTVGFDAGSESVTLAHAARDRRAFARGALLAARWVQGKSGWFTMQDVLGLQD